MEIIKIELTDGDGDLHADGLPRLIVVNVTYEGGKVKRFPWQADKSITDLFGALGNVVVPAEVIKPAAIEKEIKSLTSFSRENSNVIEKGDTVKCVKINAQNLGPAKGATVFLKVGSLYEVIEVVGAAGMATGYEVVEIDGAEQRRIAADLDEVELVSKRKTVKREKTITISAVRKCPECDEECDIKSVDGAYSSPCLNCGSILSIGYHAATPAEKSRWEKENPGKPCPMFLNDYAEVVG